jgi:hypothetical protein
VYSFKAASPPQNQPSLFSRVKVQPATQEPRSLATQPTAAMPEAKEYAQSFRDLMNEKIAEAKVSETLADMQPKKLVRLIGQSGLHHISNSMDLILQILLNFQYHDEFAISLGAQIFTVNEHHLLSLSLSLFSLSRCSLLFPKYPCIQML